MSAGQRSGGAKLYRDSRRNGNRVRKAARAPATPRGPSSALETHNFRTPPAEESMMLHPPRRLIG